ncbi:MAG: SLC13 family permease [Kiloniellaceae bacterium]
MTADQFTVFAILGALFVLLAWGRWRFDVVAFLALLVAVVAGVVPTGGAFAGFGHPATVTVAAVLILSRALTVSGATDWIAKAVDPAAGRPSTHIGTLSGLGAVMSSFMNNVGTLGLLMPVALQSAAKAKRSAATILMPLSFGSILGGLVTLIGTPPNIIVATYRGEVTGDAFGMFDFTPVGLSVALAGVAFIARIGWRRVPQAAPSRATAVELFDIDNYVTEAKVPKQSAAIGKTLREVEELTKEIDALVVELIRGKRHYRAAAGAEPLQAGDVLVIEAGPEEIDKFISALGLELVGSRGDRASPLASEDGALIEAVVTPRSRLEGRTVQSQRLLSHHGFTLLAVARQGTPYRGRLKTFRFRVGDVLLLHGETERIPEAIAAFGCLPLAERGLSLGQRGRAPVLIAIFAAAIAVATLDLLPIQIALGLAVIAMVLTNLLPLRELYEGVDWPVIILLGSLIPVGGALEATGATGVLAGAILELTAGGSAVLVLALLMIVTMTLSDILNNAATAVVMAPIGLGIAERLGADPDAFLMAVAVGASCAFLTPIGHQNNALIMGPGGYRFGDYWRLGLPLEALIVAVSLPIILIVWPL